MGEPIMEEEFEKAVQGLKIRKATWIDDIPSDLINKSGENMKKELFRLVCVICETGELPDDFMKCIIISIPKKADARCSEHYRTLSLTCHASKIITKIILRRLERKIQGFLSYDQFGFRRREGTREAILTLRQIIEKQIRKDKTTFLSFVELEKAFDNVNWNTLFIILRQAGIDYRDRRLIYNFSKA